MSSKALLGEAAARCLDFLPCDGAEPCVVIAPDEALGIIIDGCESTFGLTNGGDRWAGCSICPPPFEELKSRAESVA